MATRRTVAVVDGDEATRGTMATLLEQAGYRVRAFGRGDDFLASYLPGDADCIVLHVRMPGNDGFDVLKALDSGERLPPVLAITGQSAIPAAVEAMKLGATDFLQKPYRSEDLLEAISRALASDAKRRPGGADPEAVARVETLSQRQAEILRGILKGQPNKIMAYELGLSIRTVEAYRAHLPEKLRVRGIAEVVRLAIAAGMLETS
jgi:two-component system response regulator FixJ